MRSARSSGVTLVELLAALALFGLILGVSGLALASLRTPSASAEILKLRRARAEAIQTGAPVRAESVLFLPDGRAVGSKVDLLTGDLRAR